MTTANERQESTILLPDAALKGWLEVPPTPTGIVVFAHGSGSSRFSSRNNAVAAYLREAGLGTLLFDLLTEDEERIDVRTREYRFDIALLSERLAGAVGWLADQPGASGPSIGLFGSSTGAAAALIAAARAPGSIGAVVSRGGRADLAESYLCSVQAPTLLIVGERDTDVLQLNRAAQAQLNCISEVAIVPHATHLFEEHGALESVARLARDWFSSHLGRATEAGK